MHWRIRELEQRGCDMQGAMRRFLDDEDFYLKCLHETMEAKRLATIREALGRQDYRRAFEVAHDLKGVSGTLGLTPVYDAVCRVVEDLRYDPKPELERDLRDLQETCEKLFD